MNFRKSLAYFLVMGTAALTYSSSSLAMEGDNDYKTFSFRRQVFQMAEEKNIQSPSLSTVQEGDDALLELKNSTRLSLERVLITLSVGSEDSSHNVRIAKGAGKTGAYTFFKRDLPHVVSPGSFAKLKSVTLVLPQEENGCYPLATQATEYPLDLEGASPNTLKLNMYWGDPKESGH